MCCSSVATRIRFDLLNLDFSVNYVNASNICQRSVAALRGCLANVASISHVLT